MDGEGFSILWDSMLSHSRGGLNLPYIYVDTLRMNELLQKVRVQIEEDINSILDNPVLTVYTCFCK